MLIGLLVYIQNISVKMQFPNIYHLSILTRLITSMALQHTLLPMHILQGVLIKKKIIFQVYFRILDGWIINNYYF